MSKRNEELWAEINQEVVAQTARDCIDHIKDCELTLNESFVMIAMLLGELLIAIEKGGESKQTPKQITKSLNEAAMDYYTKFGGKNLT